MGSVIRIILLSLYIANCVYKTSELDNLNVWMLDIHVEKNVNHYWAVNYIKAGSLWINYKYQLFSIQPDFSSCLPFVKLYVALFLLPHMYIVHFFISNLECFKKMKHGRNHSCRFLCFLFTFFWTNIARSIRLKS